MSIHIPGPPPTTQVWRGRYRTITRALARNATKLATATLREAPAGINTGHVDYMLRGEFVRYLGETARQLGEGLYHVELTARHRRHRQQDWHRLAEARRHLRAAAEQIEQLGDQ